MAQPFFVFNSHHPCPPLDTVFRSSSFLQIRVANSDVESIIRSMKTSTAKMDFLTTLEVADRLGRTPQYVGMVARELGLGTLINPRLRIFSASEYRAIRAKIKSFARKPVEPS